MSTKSRGYPAMCTFMASDDDFFVLRRFGKLGARVVLRLQNEIAQLEDDLQAEDAFCMRQENPKLDNGTFALDPSERRKKIMEELTWRMERYRKCLHRCGEIPCARRSN